MPQLSAGVSTFPMLNHSLKAGSFWPTLWEDSSVTQEGVSAVGLRLPAHHVQRPRLTDSCRTERIVVVEASAGYGKSVLAAELVEAWSVVPVEVLLEEGGVSAQLLASRLRAAVQRAGFVDAAASMAETGEDAAGAVDAMLAALAAESCVFVIDDAHNAMRDAGLLIDRVASRITGAQRLVLLARQLPPGAERLRRADALLIGASDLAFDQAETLELCRSGFGLDATAEDARYLDASTGGWTAAVVLAASRARRTGQPIQTIAVAGFDPVAAVLDELTRSLGTERSVLARIAPLPLVDPDLLARVTGDEGFFARAVACGLPLTAVGGGWWQLPGPVRDHLATLGTADPEALVQAADYYTDRGEIATALQMLLGAGEAEAAARLLAEADPRRTESIDALELLSVIGRIPDEVLERHPRAVFVTARACVFAAILQARARLMQWLDERVAEKDDPVMRRAVDAEMATDLINSSTPLAALEIGKRVLAAATPAEWLTRARALTVIGQASCFRRDADGSLSDATLEEAATYFDQAIETYVAMGYPEASSGAVVERAVRVELGRGRAHRALEILDDAVPYAAGTRRRTGRLLFYRAQILTELGRHHEAGATLDEVERIGGDTGGVLASFVHWERMILASYRGDAEATLEHANQGEANRADWWAATGSEFLAEAADCLDRVGHISLAWERLRRAEADPQSYERTIAMSECALLARHGDPGLAEDRLMAVNSYGIFPRERWRVTLLRAYAAWRRGDSAAGALAAQAFEETARLGQPQLPLVRERDVTEALIAVAAETGSPAAAALESAPLPMALFVLGRFELTRGGRPVPIGPGQAVQLLKMVAACGGRVPAEQAIEALWPEADPEAGRNRLRTVLGRLRQNAHEAVLREGDLLVLGKGIRVDLAEFRRESRQARALSGGDPATAVAVAKSAIARYAGDLLPDDPYEGWADEPREAAKRSMLDLLDLCATDAANRGNLDEARRMVERSLELAPMEEDRYMRIAQILLDQGRRGAALSVLRRARAVLAPLGIDVPLRLADRTFVA